MVRGAPWVEDMNKFLMRYFEVGIEMAPQSDGILVPDETLLQTDRGFRNNDCYVFAVAKS